MEVIAGRRWTSYSRWKHKLRGRNLAVEEGEGEKYAFDVICR